MCGLLRRGHKENVGRASSSMVAQLRAGLEEGHWKSVGEIQSWFDLLESEWGTVLAG